MSDLNLTSIQAGLGVSLSRFMKIREIVKKEVEEAGLGKKTLGTNQMRKELDTLAEQIRLRVQKHIKCNNVKWTQEVLLRLIHIEKGNVARRKSVRKQTSNAKIKALGRSPATSAKPVSTIDGRKRKSPEKDAAKSASSLAVTTPQFLQKNALAPSHNQTGDTNVVAPGSSPETSHRPDSTIDDQERDSPKKDAADSASNLGGTTSQYLQKDALA
ncbi:hypothetical protein MMC31_007061 [Peltigera leucophlebia]|nr:hypothetical protein [Peltigera leucophlebia]